MTIELRLGNLITWDGDIFTVTEITKDLIRGKGFTGGELTVNSVGLIAEDYRIPLSEDWLLRFGFTKQLSFSWVKDISYFPKQELKVLSVTLGQGVLIRCGELEARRENDELIALINTDVSGPLYVHQLQNLYYALTGEELTIKEQV